MKFIIKPNINSIVILLFILSIILIMPLSLLNYQCKQENQIRDNFKSSNIIYCISQGAKEGYLGAEAETMPYTGGMCKYFCKSRIYLYAILIILFYFISCFIGRIFKKFNLLFLYLLLTSVLLFMPFFNAPAKGISKLFGSNMLFFVPALSLVYIYITLPCIVALIVALALLFKKLNIKFKPIYIIWAVYLLMYSLGWILTAIFGFPFI